MFHLARLAAVHGGLAAGAFQGSALGPTAGVRALGRCGGSEKGQAIRGILVALVSSHCQELNGLGAAHLEASQSALVKLRKSVLRISIPLIGRLPEPLGRLGVALLHTLTETVSKAQLALGLDMSLLCRLAR